MSIFGSESTASAVPEGDLAKPMMLALGALLVGKMLTGRKDDNDAAPIDQAASNPPAQPGELLGASFGGLSSLLESNSQGAAAAPGPLSGGLAGVLNQLTQAGHGDKVASWVGQGENRSIEPDQLGDALGHPTVSALAEHVGMEPQSLLDSLSQILPVLVDKLSADGQVPDSNQIASLLKSFIPAS